MNQRELIAQRADNMLNGIQDLGLREKYKRILAGGHIRQVQCLQCDRIIAFLDDNDASWGGMGGNISERPGLAARRVRTDGSIGWQCWCGNDERLLPEEEGILPEDGTPMSRAGIIEFQQRMEANPTRRKSNFRIEKIGAGQ